MGGITKKGKKKTRSRPPSPKRTLEPYLTRSQPRRSASLPPGTMAASAAKKQDPAPPAPAARTAASPMTPIGPAPPVYVDSGAEVTEAPQSLPALRREDAASAPKDGGVAPRPSAHQPDAHSALAFLQSQHRGHGARGTPSPLTSSGTTSSPAISRGPLTPPHGHAVCTWPPSPSPGHAPAHPLSPVATAVPETRGGQLISGAWLPAQPGSPPLLQVLHTGPVPSPLQAGPQAASPSWASGSPWDSPIHQTMDAALHVPSSPPGPCATHVEAGPPLPSSQGPPPSLADIPAVFRASSPVASILPSSSAPWGLPASTGHSHLSPVDRPVTLADLQALMASLPTKADLSILAKQIAAECKEEFIQLRQDVSALFTRVEAVEETTATSSSSLQILQETVHQHSAQLFTLQQHIDDVENRNRRNNIRLRGLPEAVGSDELYPALLSIFNDLLGRPPDIHIELDRAHRALRPPSQDDQNPRDVICRVHYYALKEDILRAARARRQVFYKEAQVQLFPDLSRHTLAQRAALKPILEVLRDKDIPYRWGFPFALSVRRNGKTYTLRSGADIPSFLKDLDIPDITIPDWPQLSSGAPKRQIPRSPPQSSKTPRSGLAPRNNRRQRLVTHWDSAPPGSQNGRLRPT